MVRKREKRNFTLIHVDVTLINIINVNLIIIILININITLINLINVTHYELSRHKDNQDSIFEDSSRLFKLCQGGFTSD